MNRITLLKVAAALCVIGVVACGAIILKNNVHIGLSYANAGQYAAGEAEVSGAVKHLDIDWIDGSVIIAAHAADTVALTETSEKAIGPDAALRWWLDGDTLRVRYAKSGYMSFRGLNKALTVTLPEGLRLNSVKIDATSADVLAPGLIADSIAMDLTSGDVSLSTADADSVALSLTSGDVRATLGNVNALSVDTTSGDIAVEGDAARSARIDSTSGKISVDLAAFDELRIEATSGDVDAALPSEPGFTADIDTTSGRFDTALALRQDGKRYACGDGSAQLRIHTTSGNVLLSERAAR